jgi:thymidine kinase
MFGEFLGVSRYFLIACFALYASLGLSSEQATAQENVSAYDEFLVYMEALKDKNASLSKFFSRNNIEYHLDALTDNRDIQFKITTLRVTRNNLRFGDRISAVLHHDLIRVSDETQVLNLICARSGEQFTLKLTYIREDGRWLIDERHYGAPTRYPTTD